jgi:hypothetical protein
MDYPTKEQLDRMGQTLQRDICLWSARLDREYRNVHSAPVYTRSEPDPLPEPRAPRRKHRAYLSSYVGVTMWRKTHFVALWMEAGKDKRGPIRDRTERGERWAAQDRARALGLDYLEKRDGTRVPYPRVAPEEVGNA